MQDFSALLNIDPWLIFKGFLLIFVLGYLIFALVVVRQVQLTTLVLKTTLSPWIKALAIVHLIFAIIVFFWILVLS